VKLCGENWQNDMRRLCVYDDSSDNMTLHTDATGSLAAANVFS